MTLLLERMLDYCSTLQGDGVSIAFSGGVDSLFLTLCARTFVPVQCIVVGTPGSFDVQQARFFKTTYDFPLDVVELEKNSYLRALKVVGPYLDAPDPMRANLGVVMYLVFESAKRGTVLVGHGADEYFGGYKKYQNNPHLERERANDLLHLQSDMERYI
ncbi:MAG TPA: hypothetical protein ENN76_01215, partial [Euryarchaeota archaeon]|nr:hypothetical protein [Euryarchaeota archaeon]